MDKTWPEQLRTLLIENHGKQGDKLNQKYSASFPHSYIDSYSVETAISDINYIEKLSAENNLEINFYRSSTDSADNLNLHLRLFQWDKSIPLSDILPILNNLNLRAIIESPHKITLDNHTAWISDYIVSYTHGELDLEKNKNLFTQALISITLGINANDGFNRLVLAASLSCHEIEILRTYAKYLHQVGFRFSQAYIENALINNADISKNLVELFITKFNPKTAANEKEKAALIEKNILTSLEAVTSLDEDKIIRRILDLIKATLRTNYFQNMENGSYLPFYSIKLNSRAIPELPLPMPLYEIYIYSHRFEGIHLRNTKVSRGGIRWSDRREDFRTEILGLMKAQVVKNALIVPSGAKGGFVLQALPANASREIINAEVVACYKLFINGLLALTDNIQNNNIVSPKNTVCYDDADPYLVVAADKGTAAFSDIANHIAKEHGFWLGSAFASGSSNGYDHKKMGITARGAWESIKRHFRELNLNIANTDMTVVGIGDMSGDVFGNGMIYSNHIKLIAAFDHRHIFIDPNPDPATSFAERVRLFNLPTSSWEDYNPQLISQGGGVFKRSSKIISLTPQIQKALGIEDNVLAPNELVRAILRAPVDLLYNGGIGTYVKSSREEQADVGDRSNDYCRVNGNELRCKIVGEGGNLGFTQLGRIEYALTGGLINTDSIDNSAGVDCSDHEVNLKILFQSAVKAGSLTREKRNEIMASLRPEVADLVLLDNYSQALVLSFSAYSAKKNIGLYSDYIKELETLGILNRQVEFLPDDREISERVASGEGLTRPELSILLAFSKIHIKHEILQSNLPEDPYLSKIVDTAFPPSIKSQYQSAMNNHRLKRDIIATQLSNQIVNEMGITFVYRLQIETGATVEEIVRAYSVASMIYGSRQLQKIIEAMDYQIPMADQYEMLHNLRQLLNLSSRWFLHSSHLKEDLEKLIEHYSVNIQKLEGNIPTLMGGYTKEYLESLTLNFSKAGLPIDIARRIATFRAIYTSLNIIDVATSNNFDLQKTAQVYFAAGERISLVWFRDHIASDSREGHWNVLARLTLRDELDISQRALTVAIMKKDKKDICAKKLIEIWVGNNQRSLKRWDKLIELLHNAGQIEYTMFFVTIRELISLIVTSQ